MKAGPKPHAGMLLLAKGAANESARFSGGNSFDVGSSSVMERLSA